MAPRHSEQPCFVSPHPDLVARLKAQAALTVQGVERSQASIVSQGIPEKHSVPGLGDGLIFPEEHYTEPTPISVMQTAALDRAPLRGSIKVVVVLAEFKDVKFQPANKARMHDLFFSTGKLATGSVSEYYSEVSNKKVSFDGEVVGPVTLSNNLSYYANNASGMSPTGINARNMADEAFELAKNSVSNWKQYDNDGNGYVDAFIVIHAGAAAEETANKSDLWSLKWVLPSAKSIGGVNVYGFLTVPETAKAGVCAHELGHLVFGWPDLYDTDYSSAGIGDWCLMAGGSWGGGGDRPVHPSAWCKISQDWATYEADKENLQITLKDVKTDFKIHRLWTDGDTSSKEYFLVENRQLTGFDGALPGSGLLVWHVDDSVVDNRNEFHPKIKLLQADGLDELLTGKDHDTGKPDRGDGGDPYPGLTGNKTLNAISSPNSKSYAGADTFVSITNIPASSPSMTFNITVKRVEQPKAPFDSKTWYRLKNTYQPASFSLDVINDNGVNSTGLLQMARDGNFSGQYWQIIPNADGSYFLRTMFLGPNRRLDVYGNDKTQPVLQKAGFFSGQYWFIKPWGDGTWHLENTYSGPYLYLDTMEGGPKVKLNQSNEGRPTERWTITPIRPITEAGFN